MAWSAAIPWSVLRPRIASMATRALNSGLWARRLLIGGSPFQGRYPASEVNDGACQEKPVHLNSQTYTASKAASDHLARAWQHTYRVPVLVGNCSNNYGPYRYPEKLIPLTLVNILRGQAIQVYRDGQNVRDWLYVDEHCRALDVILSKGEPGSTYCIGGHNELANIDLVMMLCTLMGELAPQHGVQLPVSPSRELITYVSDGTGASD